MCFSSYTNFLCKCTFFAFLLLFLLLLLLPCTYLGVARRGLGARPQIGGHRGQSVAIPQDRRVLWPHRAAAPVHGHLRDGPRSCGRVSVDSMLLLLLYLARVRAWLHVELRCMVFVMDRGNNEFLSSLSSSVACSFFSSEFDTCRQVHGYPLYRRKPLPPMPILASNSSSSSTGRRHRPRGGSSSASSLNPLLENTGADNSAHSSTSNGNGHHHRSTSSNSVSSSGGQGASGSATSSSSNGTAAWATNDGKAARKDYVYKCSLNGS